MGPDIKIVVLQRGWVVVGNVAHDGDQVIIERAYVVRRWGTTNGLGQIALDGPTDSTILDKVGTVRCHQLGIVCTFDCVTEKWDDRLAA